MQGCKINLLSTAMTTQLYIMPAAGLEPARRCRQQILSLPRLPIPTCRREQILY